MGRGGSLCLFCREKRDCSGKIKHGKNEGSPHNENLSILEGRREGLGEKEKGENHHHRSQKKKTNQIERQINSSTPKEGYQYDMDSR